jgi:outer membrane protein TolC
VSRLNRLETERLEVATVANAIVAVVTAERLAEVSRVSLQSALSTLDLNRRRAELGASSTVDVLRSEQEVSITRSQVVTANEGVLRAREALGLALGSTDGWGIAPDIRLDSLATDAKASCTQERDVRTRPDVRAADANARLAERDAKAPSYDFWPTIDAVSTVAYNSIDENTANREHVTWTIGAVLTWPIYDGGARYATRAARSAQAVVAREQLTDLQRRASVEVTQAYRGVTTAEHNLAIARKTRDISFETARLARVAFLNGSGTSFDLVDTARQLREAELDLAIQEFEVLRARITALLALATCRV